jgi:hypothetical protein
MDDYTEQETIRQDKVDNLIHQLLCDLVEGYCDTDRIEWDIQIISEIRESAFDWLQSQLWSGQDTWLAEQSFYPYRELKEI